MFVIDAIDLTVAIAIPSLSLLTTETNEVSEAEKSQNSKAHRHNNKSII